MRRISDLCLLTLLAVSGPAPRVELHVSANVVSVGNPIRVRCRVAPNADNRILEVGIEPYMYDAVQLDGDQARVTWEYLYEHLPCDAVAAFCKLVPEHGPAIVVSQPLHVTGCGH